MSPSKKRILILTPWVPWPVTGACQQDRFFGMLQMKTAGYDVRVIAKIHGFQSDEDVRKAYADAGVPLTLVPHPGSGWKLLLKNLPKIVSNPGLLDGATLEYLETTYKTAVKSEIERFRPDVLWVEYTTHWSILRWLRSFGIPIIVKSSLNEPKNCVDEHGGALFARLKSLPKYVGEKTAAREADCVLGITPVEEEWYRSLGAKNTATLPLRGLSRCFAEKTHEEKTPLHVVFLSSNYNMGHNRDALVFLLKSIVPAVRSAAPNAFVFHLTGSKFPASLEHELASDVIKEGFIPDLPAFLATMDIALCPWISGQGMQQKVFEPLCRGLPLLTTKTAGYPFENGKELFLCASPEDYAGALLRLRDPRLRRSMADAAREKAQSLFSEAVVTDVMRRAVEGVTNARSGMMRT